MQLKTVYSDFIQHTSCTYNALVITALENQFRAIVSFASFSRAINRL